MRWYSKKQLVEVHDPLKQGLKLYIVSFCGLCSLIVEVHDPLKQGLKQYH